MRRGSRAWLVAALFRGSGRRRRWRYELGDERVARLFRFALVRLGGDAAAAEDIVQQTFCRAIEHLDGYRGEAALYTWFCQICRNAVVDHWRARGRDAAVLVPLEDQPEIRAIVESPAPSSAITPAHSQ